MGKVTIKDIYWDLSSDEMNHNFAWDGCKDIEVVPRKIVEMIIEKCERMMDFYSADYDFTRGKKWAYDEIRAYAESLLMEFEEDE